MVFERGKSMNGNLISPITIVDKNDNNEVNPQCIQPIEYNNYFPNIPIYVQQWLIRKAALLVYFKSSVTHEGFCKNEIVIQHQNGYREIYQLMDVGYMVKESAYKLNPYNSIKERNQRIFEMYQDGYTQAFIGLLFGLNQSTVSGILKNN